MGDIWRSATPSSCSPAPTLPTLPTAASAVLKPCLGRVCFCMGFMPFAIHIYMFSYNPVRDNYLFGPYDAGYIVSVRRMVMDYIVLVKSSC